MIVYIIKQRQSKNCVWRQKKSHPCQVLVILQYCIIRVGFFFFFSGKIFRLPSFLWYVPLLINYLFFFLSAVFSCTILLTGIFSHCYFFCLLFQPCTRHSVTKTLQKFQQQLVGTPPLSQQMINGVFGCMSFMDCC